MIVMFNGHLSFIFNHTSWYRILVNKISLIVGTASWCAVVTPSMCCTQEAGCSSSMLPTCGARLRSLTWTGSATTRRSSAPSCTRACRMPSMRGRTLTALASVLYCRPQSQAPHARCMNSTRYIRIL